MKEYKQIQDTFFKKAERLLSNYKHELSKVEPRASTKALIDKSNQDIRNGAVFTEKDRGLAITKITASYFGTTPDEIYGKGREEPLPYIRRINTYLLKKHTFLSMTQIAKLIKPGFDRTSVTNRIDIVEDQLEYFARKGKDPQDYIKNITAIENIINGTVQADKG